MPVKERIGRVISDKMQKTITVLVETRVQHPRFKKTITRRKKFYAHDEREEARIGDIVRIRETRPLSKLKRWRLVEIIRRAPSELVEIAKEEGLVEKDVEETPELREVLEGTSSAKSSESGEAS
jgi:small subunit ribosomal protein S17